MAPLTRPVIATRILPNNFYVFTQITNTPAKVFITVLFILVIFFYNFCYVLYNFNCSVLFFILLTKLTLCKTHNVTQTDAK